MSVRKYIYHIIINGGTRLNKPLICSYSNTNDIEIHLKKNAVSFVFCCAKDYSSSSNTHSYLDYLVRDLIKKAMTLSLLKYKSPIRLKKIEIEISNNKGNKKTIDGSKYTRVFSLRCGSIKDKNYRAFSNEELQSYLNIKKTSNDQRLPMIYSYILGKYTDFEYEKFNHNWIAFNAMYSYIAIICHKKLEKNNDKIEMGALCEYFNMGVISTGRNQRNELCLAIERILINLQSRKNTIEVLSSESKKRISALLLEGMKIDSFFIFDFSYYLRCKYFHGERSIPLFAYEDDYELMLFRIANHYLSQFLNEKVPLLFDN